MKWIFFTLLFANAGYLGYQLLLVPESNPVVSHAGWAQPESEPPLQLLSESVGVSDRDREVEEVLENPIVFVGDQTIQGCQRLGPFEDVISGQDIAERFVAAGFSVELRAIDTPTGEFDYRVVIPPLASLQEAFRKLRELKSRDIDSYVISEGDDAQGISLGVFTTEDAAAAHQQQLASEGYEALIKDIARVDRGYWLFAAEGELFQTDLLQMAEGEYSAIQVTETSCLN